jgi:hypothetical protein
MAQYSVSRKDHFNAANNDLHEVMMLARKDGTVNNGANPAGMAVDAFGRARVSMPLTLFDSSHRFADNDLFTEDTTGDGASAFDANEGLVNMTVGTASGAEIIRETNKVFSYQPGKSLQNLNTFVFEPAKANLRQRVGYFGEKNGIYLELDGTDLYVVERSSVTGSTVNTRIAQSNWNIDPLDGTGISGVTLDLSKAQIQFIDIEWLGLGTVRTGFVINGEYIHCHSFHHANINNTTYITTASLPLRYELTNTGLTATASTMKQVCSTVISEGGYELRGRQQAVETPISTPRDLTVAATYYPVISIRLKSTPDRLDAIVILTALSILGVGNNGYFNWRVIAGGDTTGGTWTSADANSAVEYNLGGTSFSFTGSRTLASGFIASTTQSAGSIDILKEALFKFQLERDTFASKAEELTLVVAAKTSGDDVYASLDWEEITR